MGVLKVGDKLPMVKEVVAEVAVNANTVMKAYWQLEHEGLVEGRQDVGTFVGAPCPTARRRRPSTGWAAAWSAGSRRPARRGSMTRPSNHC
jgi:DNA-binding transcriptional regulator YhcF (GntR family)